MFPCRTFLYDLSGNPGLQNSSGQSSLHLVCQVDNGVTNVDSMLSLSHKKTVWFFFFLVAEPASAFSIPVVAGGTAEVSVSFGKESLQLDAPPQLARQVTLEALAWKLKFSPGFEQLDVTGMVAALWGRRDQRGGWSTSTAGHLSKSPLNIIIPPRAM